MCSDPGDARLTQGPDTLALYTDALNRLFEQIILNTSQSCSTNDDSVIMHLTALQAIDSSLVGQSSHPLKQFINGVADTACVVRQLTADDQNGLQRRNSPDNSPLNVQ